MGKPFQTPFADPPGRGFSSSTQNVLWGGCNFLAAYLLPVQAGTFDLRAVDDSSPPVPAPSCSRS